MIPALTNKVTSSFASSSTIPTAAGMDGITQKPCTSFMTEQGCHYGRKCQYNHPPRLSREMLHLWQYRSLFQGVPKAENQ
eukprot:5472782-Prorocentrum_lima.AAC.1